MKRILVVLTAILFFGTTFAQDNKKMEDNSNKLAVLWTSDDPHLAEKMAFMYTYNAKRQGWFDEVVLIIWGPSARLASENEMIQDYLKKMKDQGIKLEACLYCAKMYGVEDKLADLGVDVKGMGIPLTNYLKDGWRTLSL